MKPAYRQGGTAMVNGTTPKRIAIIGGGISGLGAAWALNHHPDRFDFRIYEAGDQDQVGGNAITADMPQDDGGSIPFDISVTALIPSVYHHILLLMRKFGIELLDTTRSIPSITSAWGQCSTWAVFPETSGTKF